MLIRIHHRTQAFSLIEVVLALGVIAVSLVAILGVFPTGLAASRSSVSDTRAAQIVHDVTATIDAQCTTFSSIDAFGLPLDLTTLSTGDIKNLYVSYPTPLEPKISATQSTDSIYTVELKFDSDPALTGAPTSIRLGPGKLNRIQLRIFSRTYIEGGPEFFFLARNKA